MFLRALVVTFKEGQSDDTGSAQPGQANVLRTTLWAHATISPQIYSFKCLTWLTLRRGDHAKF